MIHLVITDPVPKEVICSQCEDLLMIPFKCNECNFVCCRKCIDKSEQNNNHYTYCDTNKTQFKEISNSDLVFIILAKLLLKCKNYNKGCTCKLYYPKILKHFEVCEFYTVKCLSCHNEFKRDEYESHSQKCESPPIKCSECKLNSFRNETHNFDLCTGIRQSIVLKTKMDNLVRRVSIIENYSKINSHGQVKDKLLRIESKLNEFEIKFGKSTKINEERINKILGHYEKGNDNILKSHSDLLEKSESIKLKFPIWKKNMIIARKFINSILNYEKLRNTNNVLERLKHLFTTSLIIQNQLLEKRIKFKIYKNKPFTFFLENGFVEVYKKPYSHSTLSQELNEIRSKCSENSLICVGGKRQSEPTISICCVDNFDCLLPTSNSYKAVKNKSAFWYNFEGKSFGFTDKEDINLYPANFLLNENSLSWHLGKGGWSLGTIKGLNTSIYFEKIILIKY